MCLIKTMCTSFFSDFSLKSVDGEKQEPERKKLDSSSAKIPDLMEEDKSDV